MKVKGKHVVLALVFLITGFIFTTSYELATERNAESISAPQWRAEDALRDEILREQGVNQDIAEELGDIQSQIRQTEEDIMEKEKGYSNLVEELDKLRMITGTSAVIGDGISVVLEDAEYIKDGENPNEYIVHEQHIQKVVDELIVSGAEAVAINGHRISHQSYIQCIGPVIEIDDNISFAPFEITAIGDKGILNSAINITGGVVDQLLSDNIKVKIQERNGITLDPYYSESR